MREVIGDLWDVHDQGAHVAITTNGSLTTKGRAVLGRGVALEATQRYPALPDRLGVALALARAMVLVYGTAITPHPARDIPVAYFPEWRLLAFPVKRVWTEPADLVLITASAYALMAAMDAYQLPAVYLVRPGCGNGRLTWAEVRPRIAPIFDDRVVIIERPT